MSLATDIDDRRPATSPDGERPPRPNDRLHELVGEVRAARPCLLDGVEAPALVEPLGYTDARVRRELGFTDTLSVGEEIYLVSRDGRRPQGRWEPKIESLLTIIARSAASTLIYAVPWLTVFVAQLIRPDA